MQFSAKILPNNRFFARLENPGSATGYTAIIDSSAVTVFS